MKLTFKTFQNPTRSEKRRGACCGKLFHSEILNLDGMAEDLAKRHRLDIDDARYYCSLIGNYAMSALCEGKKLDFGCFSLYLKLKGAFPSANSGYDPKRNSISLAVAASKEMKRRLAELSPENAGGAAKPTITSIICRGVDPQREKVLLLGEVVLVAGDNFLVDASRDDEGVWLADATTGAMLVRGEVANCTRTTLDCTFPADAELRPGEYDFVVFTRCGDADAPAPSRTKLRVTVAG